MGKMSTDSDEGFYLISQWNRNLAPEQCSEPQQIGYMAWLTYCSRRRMLLRVLGRTTLCIDDKLYFVDQS